MATQAQVDELLTKMAAERARLLALVESLSEEEAERAPVDAEGEAQWSVKQQLAHLAEMETAYRAWVERALEEDGADVSRVRGAPPAIPLERAHEHSVAEHIAELRRQRERTLALIATMRPEDFDRTATQPMFGTLTVLQWLRSYYRHDRMHIDQISGREPEYRPRFVGGREPDQRR
ncbi:MAG TPA: DinB family protein [Dehalococcoidia bacterium]|nr:DinB family protein [Dehalococcoidia bacterium]